MTTGPLAKFTLTFALTCWPKVFAFEHVPGSSRPAFKAPERACLLLDRKSRKKWELKVKGYSRYQPDQERYSRYQLFKGSFSFFWQKRSEDGIVVDTGDSGNNGDMYRAVSTPSLSTGSFGSDPSLVSARNEALGTWGLEDAEKFCTHWCSARKFIDIHSVNFPMRHGYVLDRTV